MSPPSRATDTQVLIAGGGPIGLALAADLGRRGVRALLVERSDRIDDPQIAALYAARLVLARPDGHVAWRGDVLPPSCEALIDTVRGAGPRVAARRATPA